MNVSRYLMMISIALSTSAVAKTFKVTNPTSGQTIKVHCFNPNSTQCKYKIEEAKERVLKGTNQGVSSLSAARAQDTARATGDAISDTVSTGVERTQAGLAIAREKTVEGFNSARTRTMSGVNTATERTGEFLRNTGERVRSGVEAAKGKTYRVKVPGYEHSMTFHCFGGLESKECQEEKNVVVAAIKGGTDAKTLEEFRHRPLYRAKDFVVDSAITAKDKTVEFVSRLDHISCRDKLARHAKDFDNDYAQKGNQLVSYQEKLNYIEEKLKEEGRMNDCQSHFDNAVLGYQLKWVGGGELAQEKTHIFDGLGRLADGGVGYWKNEERGDYSSGASAM